jgi:hypothetical protein
VASGSGPPPWSLPVNPVPQASPEDGFTGFLVGAGAGLLDYRSAALIHHLGGRGGGILGVIETTGQGEPGEEPSYYQSENFGMKERQTQAPAEAPKWGAILETMVELGQCER